MEIILFLLGVFSFCLIYLAIGLVYVLIKFKPVRQEIYNWPMKPIMYLGWQYALLRFRLESARQSYIDRQKDKLSGKP